MSTTPRERNARCSVARSLDVLGEKWTLLVVREAFFGVTRFADFRARLGVAPDVLTARLETLVEGGVLARRPYQDEGQRQQPGERGGCAGGGRATPAGRGGRRHRPDGVPPPAATPPRGRRSEGTLPIRAGGAVARRSRRRAPRR